MSVLVRSLVLGTLALVLALGAVGAWAWWEDRPMDGSVTQRLRIPPGESLGVTAQRLADQRLVRNPVLFRWLYQVWLGDGAMPSGTFDVPGGLTALQAARYFRHARPIEVKVTVPEGWTSGKIARLLEASGVVSAEAFLQVVRHPQELGPGLDALNTLEGRLFPDTYRFPLGSSAADVARIMVRTFTERTAGLAGVLPLEQVNQRLILASIVEREYRAPDEAPLIASVFQNRLDHNVALASCATIEYILTEIQGRPHPRRIFFVHTEIPSPYNTYLNKGLPPAPIANPGLTALKAAFAPAATNYLYFVVADPALGTHTFSSNYSQHERARELYLATFVSKG